MSDLIRDRQPASMFRYFEQISAIPRGSGNEKAVSDYLCRFAEDKGLEYHQDALYNVIIKKPGSAGAEQKPAVMLQGHLDMVCEKNGDCLHDFEHDGLRLIVKDGFLSAEGTTLGGDNGIAVAMMMALLADDTLIHPPLECVFTVQEEVGLVGASSLDGSLLSARTMINLDSEEEGIATVSCAGGLRMQFDRQAKWQSGIGKSGLLIKISGLPGGHSGMDIDKGRTNANQLMGRVLASLPEPFDIADIKGGNKDNAIPREAEALLAFDSEDAKKQAEHFLDAMLADLREEISAAEPAFALKWESALLPERLLDRDTAVALVRLLYLAPNGVLSRNIKQGGFVVTSSNLGVVRMTESGVQVVISPRSSSASLQAEIKQRLSLLGQLFGFTVSCNGEYPGWNYAECSPIRDCFVSSYRALFGQELKLEAIHAGLECGLFQAKLPGLDAIAIGPTILDCHTPQERLDLASCERTWLLVTDVLNRMAEK
ncbi:MAG: aminoacyl-histidine dipeptidase [Clostridiales bacterium]|nr:aminoacyl-histidine dipeptidase [Clostridiales bacterium]